MLNKELLDYIKHLTENDTKTLSQKALKAAEEIGELAKVVLPYDNAFATTHRFVNRSKIIEEVCDTLLCILSIAYELDATDEEIEQMVNHKTKKWADLQAREGRVKYPIPYEIHITVDMKVDKFGQAGPSIDDFKIDCSLLGVKPILLDLHLQDGAVVKDMMTSSTFMGNNREAYQEMKRISQGLKSFDYKVIREKIETIPWHPAAPSEKHVQPVMPPNCYFECHINVLTTDDKLEELKGLAEEWDSHMSRNAFKKFDDGQLIIMVTYRSYKDMFETFKEHLDTFKPCLESFGFKWEKEIVEFSIYDTKVSHDAAWISGKDNTSTNKNSNKDPYDDSQIGTMCGDV